MTCSGYNDGVGHGYLFSIVDESWQLASMPAALYSQLYDDFIFRRFRMPCVIGSGWSSAGCYKRVQRNIVGLSGFQRPEDWQQNHNRRKNYQRERHAELDVIREAITAWPHDQDVCRV